MLDGGGARSAESLSPTARWHRRAFQPGGASCGENGFCTTSGPALPLWPCVASSSSFLRCSLGQALLDSNDGFHFSNPSTAVFTQLREGRLDPTLAKYSDGVNFLQHVASHHQCVHISLPTLTQSSFAGLGGSMLCGGCTVLCAACDIDGGNSQCATCSGKLSPLCARLHRQPDPTLPLTQRALLPQRLRQPPAADARGVRVASAAHVHAAAPGSEWSLDYPHTHISLSLDVAGGPTRPPRRSAFISRSGSHAHSGGARRRRDTTCTPRAPPLQRHAPRRTVAPTPWAVASEPGRGCALTSGTS